MTEEHHHRTAGRLGVHPGHELDGETALLKPDPPGVLMGVPRRHRGLERSEVRRREPADLHQIALPHRHHVSRSTNLVSSGAWSSRCLYADSENHSSTGAETSGAAAISARTRSRDASHSARTVARSVARPSVRNRSFFSSVPQSPSSYVPSRT